MTPRAIALLLWLAVVAGARAVRPFEGGLLGVDAIETFAAGTLLLVFASSRRLVSLLDAIGAPRAVFVVALFALVLWGQLARDNRASFPFLHWSMYTGAAPSNAYFEFEARHRDGATRPFPFGALTPFAGSRFVAAQGRGLEDRVARWLRDDGGAATSPDTARAELAKLVALYNARHPGDPIVAASVVRRVVPIRDFAGRESVAREPVLELRVDE